MIDFFMFSWGEVLTSLRFVFVLVLAVVLLVLIAAFLEASRIAVSYGRVFKHVIKPLTYKDYWPFIKHCYRVPNAGIQTTWNDGSYWKGTENWAYYDKKKGEWVRSKGVTND